MEYLGVLIAILLVLLLVILLYVAVSWTLWRKKRQQSDETSYKYLQQEEDMVHTKVAAVYAQENMPKISITTVQPRPEFPAESLGSVDDDNDDDDLSESLHPDLGRLYFSLRYDTHRSVLVVCLARAEDIPVEPEASGTFIDVHLLPLNTQSQTFRPYDTSISVSFRETYEFPLTKHELAVQTLDFHICRYDRFSHRTSIGDVFLALAELGAQGIDLSREVFLCRNIISSQQIYSAVEKKRLSQTDEEEQEERDWEQREKKTARRSVTNPWQILKEYVRSGKYKKFFGLETTMLWEPLFTREASVIDETGFYSALDTPVKSKERKSSSSFTFPPHKTAERQGSSGSSQTSPLQISPAPKDYYKIVPITPFTSSGPSQSRKQSPEMAPQSHSWQLPESRGDSVAQKFGESGEESRVVSSTPVERKGPKEPETRGAKARKSLLPKGARHKGTVTGTASRKLRKAPSSPRRKKTYLRSEGRAKATGRAVRNRSSTASSKASKRTSSQSSLSSASVSSLTESLRMLAEPSECFPNVKGHPGLGSYSSVDTEEFRTPLPSPFIDLGLSERTRSDPDLSTKHEKGGIRARLSSSTGDVRSRESEDEDAA